jgi:hypothetical protein
MKAKPLGMRLSAVAVLLALGSSAAFAAGNVAWNQAENVKGAANQIGDIQKREGAARAVKFIGACYATHGLSSAYSKAFEGCIAQDYMQSRALAMIYARVDEVALKKMGSPTSDEIAKSLNQRMGAAFAKYKISVSDGQQFVKLVEEQGVPVFLKIIFPKREGGAPSEQPKDKQ